jgi:hypothetical protein
MTTTIKALSRGAFSTSSATLYTVPASTTTVVTNIVITNTGSSDEETFTITLDGTEVFAQVSIFSKQTVAVDIKQALATTKIVAGLASSTEIKYHITGVEIS